VAYLHFITGLVLIDCWPESSDSGLLFSFFPTQI
jgi:hypothetical protein